MRPVSLVFRSVFGFVLALLLVACGTGAGRLLLLDATGALDAAGLAPSAAPLVARNITVVVSLVDSGGPEGFAARLDAAGLLHGGQIDPDAVGVYVSLSPRYSELRAGANWSTYLPAPALERVRQGVLNPALREGRVAEALVATLSAIEGEIQSQQHWLRVQVGSVVGIFVFIVAGLLLMSNQDEIARQLKRSAPGKLAAWIWERTPAGRAEARREQLQSLAEERARIDERDQKVRELLAVIDTPQDFQETLDELSARRTALLKGESLAELRALRSAYDSWMTDVEDLIGTREVKQSRAASARRQMARLRADIERSQKPTRSQRKGTPPRPVSPDDLAQFARLEARLANLDESDAKLARLWHTAQDRQVWLHQLGTAYRSLEAEAMALWREACPEAYAAEQARQRAAEQASPSYESSSYTPSSSSDSSSSSSDWSSSDYGGGESRAGGDW
jgi:hypothetical protein